MKPQNPNYFKTFARICHYPLTCKKETSVVKKNINDSYSILELLVEKLASSEALEFGLMSTNKCLMIIL